MDKKLSEGELRDNIFRLKLGILNERIQKENSDFIEDNNRSKNFTTPSWVEIRDYERECQIREMNLEIKDAKRKYEKLKNKLKTQKLENQRVNNSLVDINKPDKVNKYLEMLVVQQSQSQSTLMNQLMLMNQQIKQTPVNVYLPPNYPAIYPHYAMFPNPDNYQNNKSEIQVNQKETKPSTILSKPMDINHPYPGNDAQQTLRQLGLAALFCGILESNYSDHSVALTEKFLLGLKIDHIINVIQTYYNKDGGPMYTALQSVIASDIINYKILLSKSGNSKDRSATEQSFNDVLQNIISNISEIMPKTGTLGCESRSILSEILQTNQTYPDNYFFLGELALIKIDSSNTIRNIGKIESLAILIGIFYVRAFVIKTVMKSESYGLSKDLSLNAKTNLRILSSVIIRIYRMILADFILLRYPESPDKKKVSIDEFDEMKEFLIKDEELEPMWKDLKKSIEFCKTTILSWANTYVMKLKPV